MFKKREICVVFGLAALLAAVAYINHDDQSYKFDSLTQQHKASYCAGVYEYGKTYATDKSRSIHSPRPLSGSKSGPSPSAA